MKNIDKLRRNPPSHSALSLGGFFRTGIDLKIEDYREDNRED